MIELETVSKSASVKFLETSAPTILIGRSPENTIVFDERSVSRHHGELVLVHEHYQYRDLNSTHGTVLRRAGRDKPIKQVSVQQGDELHLGLADNWLRVVSVSSDPVNSEDIGLTTMHASVDAFGSPEDVFAHDSEALRMIVQADSRLMDAAITTERQVIEELLRHIPRIFEMLDYVAVIEEGEDGIRAYDCKIIADGARIRLSKTLTSKAAQATGAFAFSISTRGELGTSDGTTLLSASSRLGKEGGDRSLDDTTGICAPLRNKAGTRKYLVLERRKSHGSFTSSHVMLANALSVRVRDRIDNLELVRQNQVLNSNATLGVFAGMIGHDIKNYLFFGKRLSEIRNDPLGAHPGILKGIERSRKLAQSMKDLVAPGHVTLKPFSPEALARSITTEFAAMFGDVCRFELDVAANVATMTSSEELLNRVVWNLVMNAFHTIENRRGALTSDPFVRISLSLAGDNMIVIEVSDNAGGIGPRTLDYMQRSFALIARVYEKEEDLINVVNTINKMEGFTNSVGLFFTAVAVNDMGGSLEVTTVHGEGSSFRLVLPRRIDALRRLLRF